MKQMKALPLAERARAAQESMEELGRAAVDKLEDARKGTANALHLVASSVRARTRQTTQTLNDVAGNAAAKLDQTSTYIRKHAVSSILSEITGAILRNPTPSP